MFEAMQLQRLDLALLVEDILAGVARLRCSTGMLLTTIGECRAKGNLQVYLSWCLRSI